jgi:ankyrin repeat protein
MIMRVGLHNLMTKTLLSAAWITLFALSGCAATSAHGADQYFTGSELKLAIASEDGDLDAIRRLIKEDGVKPDNSFSSRDGIPLLAWPLRAKSLDGLRAMLENGANPNARLVKQMNGEVVHFNNAMVYAAKMDDPRFLALLLKHGGDPNTRNSNNETLLYQAFISGNQWDNVKLLVEGGADVNEPSLGASDTPISWYSGRGAFEHVYWLLQHGADPSVMLKSSIGEPDRMFIAEHIYWGITTPDLLPWQKKCQQWLVDRNIPRPPMPEGIRQKREAFGFPTREEDVPLL